MVVSDLLEHPVLGFLTGAALEAEHHPLPLHPLALEVEMKVPFLDGLGRVLAGLGDPAPAIPQHHRPAAIFARGDGALEVGIIERMILGAHRKPLVGGVNRGAARDRPALEYAVHFEAEVPVQPAGVMLLDDETVAFCAALLA